MVDFGLTAATATGPALAHGSLIVHEAAHAAVSADFGATVVDSRVRYSYAHAAHADNVTSYAGATHWTDAQHVVQLLVGAIAQHQWLVARQDDWGLSDRQVTAPLRDNTADFDQTEPHLQRLGISIDEGGRWAADWLETHWDQVEARARKHVRTSTEHCQCGLDPHAGTDRPLDGPPPVSMQPRPDPIEVGDCSIEGLRAALDQIIDRLVWAHQTWAVAGADLGVCDAYAALLAGTADTAAAEATSVTERTQSTRRQVQSDLIEAIEQLSTYRNRL